MLASMSLTSRRFWANLMAVASLHVASASAIERVERIAPGSPAGAALILSKGCGACHVIPGIEGADGMVGPP